jgi:hypothetical protein
VGAALLALAVHLALHTEHAMEAALAGETRLPLEADQ